MVEKSVIGFCWLPNAYRMKCVCEECCDNCVCSPCLIPWIGHRQCAAAGCVSHFHKNTVRHRIFFILLWVYRRWWATKKYLRPGVYQ